jgi:hypothetical protein
MDCLDINKFIIIRTQPPNGCDGFPHFAHVMEYFYFAISIILNYPRHIILLYEPYQYYSSYYINEFISKMKLVLKDRFLLINYLTQLPNTYDKIYNFQHNKHIVKDGFIHYDTKTRHIDDYYKWFLYNNSNIMRDLFLPNINNTKNSIAIINRKQTRKFINNNLLVSTIKSNIDIPIKTYYFEDESFDNQISIFKNNNIIIAPHGAALTNIPFSPDNAIIIECCHDEWHPYYYFPGLSFSTNKFHAILCNTPSVFPAWYSPDYQKHNNNKLDITPDIDKILKVINIYLNNEFKEKKCYLF